MTSKKAIEIMHDMKNHAERTDDKELMDACDTAIKALEQQPCEDCISRQAVLDVLKKHWLSGTVAYRVIDEIGLSINALPSVTPKEKTAAWVGIDQEPHEVYECNACGWLLYDEDRTDFKYCPNCGARMQEVEENG